MPHVEILDQEESLRGPLLQSLGVHFGLLASIVGIAVWTGGPLITLGAQNPGGGSGAVQVTAAAIPIPNRSPRLNEVANDTESMVRARRQPQPVKPRVDEEGIGIERKARKQPKKRLDLNKYAQNRERVREEEDNQLTSDAGARASSPIFAMPGGGQIGTGPNAPMGGRFGAYIAAVQQCVGRKFREQGVASSARANQAAIVRFDIQRNGNVRTASIQQTSGNLDVDRASQRAVLDCSPFPTLPPAFERNEATIEFWFEFKK